MSRLHVTDDGRVLPCTATIQTCSYGSDSDERHFDNVENAQKKATELLLQRYDTFSGMTRGKDKVSPRNKERSTAAIKNNSRSLELNTSLISNRFDKVPSSMGSSLKEFASSVS